ncbi:MAG: hypothetical protein K2J69_00250, partial [Malacoplasma sp.]|nr:hypothetical protein [Malacoplasma sp.]
MLLLINKEYASLVMPSVISTPLVSMPFIILTTLIFDLKKNSIVERIFVFSKKPIHSNVIVAIYCFLLVFSSFIWNIFLVFLISLNRNIFNYDIFENVSWSQVFFVALLATFLSVSISSVIYTFMKSALQGQLIGYLISAFSLVFSGIVVPMSTLSSVSVLNYLSYFSPFKYINSSLVIAMNGTSSGITIFDLNRNFEIGAGGNSVVFHSYDLSLNIFVPLILTAILFSISSFGTSYSSPHIFKSSYPD